jgi:hypothetical protein
MVKASLQGLGLQRGCSTAMESKEAFRNLLIMAAIDGRMTVSELRLLSHRAMEWGIDDDDFEAALEEAQRGDSELALPLNPRQALAMLRDMLRVMAADGQVAETEKNLFAIASSAMGVQPREVDRLINEVLREDGLEEDP